MNSPCCSRGEKQNAVDHVGHDCAANRLRNSSSRLRICPADQDDLSTGVAAKIAGERLVEIGMKLVDRLRAGIERRLPAQGQRLLTGWSVRRQLRAIEIEREPGQAHELLGVMSVGLGRFHLALETK